MRQSNIITWLIWYRRYTHCTHNRCHLGALPMHLTENGPYILSWGRKVVYFRGGFWWWESCRHRVDFLLPVYGHIFYRCADTLPEVSVRCDRFVSSMICENPVDRQCVIMPAIHRHLIDLYIFAMQSFLQFQCVSFQIAPLNICDCPHICDIRAGDLQMCGSRIGRCLFKRVPNTGTTKSLPKSSIGLCVCAPFGCPRLHCRSISIWPAAPISHNLNA